jgi:DNA-3-methyladenine glycosylase II
MSTSPSRPHARALRHLRASDPVLAGILHGRPFDSYPNADVYLDLLESILSQQLSVKAAATIFGRFRALFPGGYPDPRTLAALSDAALRAAGVSRQKAGYLRNVAAFALAHDLSRAGLDRLSDDELMELLTQIKGVGRWTAEVLLMFSLGRPDVFPADDLGIQVAMKKLYRLRGAGPRLRRRMIAIAERWRPHRSLACRYLWRWRNL